MPSFRPFTRAVAVWPKSLSGRMNTWVSFHADVTLAAGRRATLRIAAAPAYRIWINGEFAGRGPARAAHGHARVDEWPIQAGAGGELAVVIEVVGYGVPTFCTTFEPPFCCVEVVAAGRVIAWTAPQGGTFSAEHRTERVQRVERYSYQRAFVEAYRFPVAGQPWCAAGYVPAKPARLAHFAPRRTVLPRGVAYPDLGVQVPRPNAVRGRALPFSKAMFAKAEKWRHIFEVPKVCAGYPPAQLEWPVSRFLSGTRFKSDGALKLGPRLVRLAAKRWVRADFGVDLTGFPALRVKARKATRLIVLFDEILVGGQVKYDRSACVNALWLDLPAGTDVDFEAFEPYTFRYLQVLVWEGEAEVSNLRIRRYASSVTLADAPAGLAPAAAQVRKAALMSFRQNALDIYMDCPARERAGWLCDSLYTARAEWHLTGDNRIERDFLENYLVVPKFRDLPAGMVPMCYPAEALEKMFIPNWAMFFIVQLDEARRVRRLPAAWQPLIERRVRGLLDYFRPFENDLGLLEKLKSWVFVEWSKANEFVQDVNFPTNMLYSQTLRAAARLLRDPKLAAKADRVAARVRELAWRDGRFADNAVRDQAGKLVVTEHASEVCQYYAFFTGVADVRRETALWRRLVRADYGPLYPANVFVGKIMRFELLLDHGEHEAARREVIKSYLPMARLTGTLWELFQDTVSCNHGFTSYIAVLIDRLAAEGK
ncbi:MAG TPA: hypothetical protein PLU52_03815 [Opitutaceae bacterium]|nr:hypothetical protein [Opitutaceae bacterium]HND60474.1 hypothetical protein [Opitutaceae bacterium]